MPFNEHIGYEYSPAGNKHNYLLLDTKSGRTWVLNNDVAVPSRGPETHSVIKYSLMEGDTFFR